VTAFAIVAVIVVLVAAVLFLPHWGGRRRAAPVSLLSRYQTIVEALLEGDTARAREEFKEIIRADTEDVPAYLRLARFLRREGDLERAVAVQRSLVARRMRDVRIRRQVFEGLITDLLLLRRFADARAVAETLRTFDRRNPHVVRAELYDALHRDEWEAALKAVATLKRSGASRADPEPFQLRTYMAERLAAAGDPREARKLLEEALKVSPQFAPALFLLGELWAREGEPEKSAEIWVRLLRERPEVAGHVIDRLEKSYFEMGRFGELTPLYAELAAAGGARAPLLKLAQARMALRTGDIDEALRVTEDLSAPGSGDAQAICWRTHVLLEAGRAPAAGALLKDVVEAAVQRPPGLLCVHCGAPVEPHTVRCAQCLGWLPDPFMRRGGAPHHRQP